VRDLGGAFYQAGQYGKAIGPLEWYLRAVPKAEDRDMVLQVLARAKAQVGRWN
jgi:regulator of sirC expression with transglutaminase-like and TPR domain